MAGRGVGDGGEWLYGRQAVRESLRAGRRSFRELVVTLPAAESPIGSEIVSLARSAGARIRTGERSELDRLTRGAHHQGVALRATPYPYVSLDEALASEEPPLALALDELQDPQNLGTLLRTADAVAVSGVLIPERRAAGITPAVVNASSGAVEHLRVAQVTNLARALRELKRRGLWVLGLEALPDARPLWELDLPNSVCVVVGSEGEGIRRLVLEQCDLVARLPMRGHVNSLNAAVSGSIALYSIAQRRDFSSA